MQADTSMQRHARRWSFCVGLVRTCQLALTEFLKFSAAASFTESSTLSMPTICTTASSFACLSMAERAVKQQYRQQSKAAKHSPPKSEQRIQVKSTVASMLLLLRSMQPATNLTHIHAKLRLKSRSQPPAPSTARTELGGATVV